MCLDLYLTFREIFSIPESSSVLVLSLIRLLWFPHFSDNSNPFPSTSTRWSELGSASVVNLLMSTILPFETREVSSTLDWGVTFPNVKLTIWRSLQELELNESIEPVQDGVGRTWFSSDDSSNSWSWSSPCISSSSFSGVHPPMRVVGGFIRGKRSDAFVWHNSPRDVASLRNSAWNANRNVRKTWNCHSAWEIFYLPIHQRHCPVEEPD